MEELKLEAILKWFFEKLISWRFEYTDLVSFLWAIRFNDSLFSNELTGNLILEIAHFSAHQNKNKWIIVEKLQSWKTISDYIQVENINVSHELKIDSIPEKVFLSICRLHGDELASYYKRVGSVYILRQSPSYIRKSWRILKDIFFSYSFDKPLIEAEALYTDFISCLYFFRGKFWNLPQIPAFWFQKKLELLICLCSVLANTKISFIKSAPEKFITPKFEKKDEKVYFKYLLKYIDFPTAWIQLKDEGAIEWTFINISFESVEFKFSDWKSIVSRDDKDNLIFL